ncbi:MAG: cobalamin biosynthesis protein [Sporomusaceae bacterium]|nr:cobalamin biosynthesis protein [Sporomusaceae bacterium]
MRIAIISITNEGARLADRLTASLQGEIEIFAKVGRNPAGAKEYNHLGQLVATLFHQYDSFVFIMTVGVVVRIIAPHVRDKRYDPAVVVLDEAGNHAISLLSGHLGHSNALTTLLGQAVQAKAIITTSNDTLQKPAVDLLAVKLNAAIEPFDNLCIMDAAIDHGENVAFFIDTSLVNYETYLVTAAEFDITLLDIKDLTKVDNYDAAVVITDKDLYMVKPCLFLRPPTLVAGISCRQDTSSSEILSALADSCKKIGRSMKSIAAIASSEAREDEIGVLATAQQIEVPMRFFPIDDLLRHAGRREGSPNPADARLDPASVCETAALMAAKADSLVLAASHYDNVIVALAEAKSCWWE